MTTGRDESGSAILLSHQLASSLESSTRKALQMIMPSIFGSVNNSLVVQRQAIPGRERSQFCVRGACVTDFGTLGWWPTPGSCFPVLPLSDGLNLLARPSDHREFLRREFSRVTCPSRRGISTGLSPRSLLRRTSSRYANLIVKLQALPVK
jgi:hypothetical protein